MRERILQGLILLIVCTGMSVRPVFNHFGISIHLNREQTILGLPTPQLTQHPPGTNKDYPLWFETGLKVRLDFDVYPRGKAYPFMYPPFAGWLLALLSYLGQSGMFFALIGLNVISLALAVELSVRLVAGTGRVGWWLRILPSACCFFFINDMFFLGQPNLGLLVLMLLGFHALRGNWPALAGVAFALAAAIKAFPVVVIVYLLYHRAWAAVIAMILGVLVCLLVLPATLRGWDRNLDDLDAWAAGMLFRQGEEGLGQRPEQSLSWQNQSLFGVGHRLLRHVDADILNEKPHTPIYVNLLDLSYGSASKLILLAAALLGLFFILVMPGRAARTRSTDACEFGMLLILITIGTPYAYLYYPVWMLLPFTVLVYRAQVDPSRTNRRVAGASILLALLLYAAGAPITQNYLLLACGSMFWAEMILLLSLAWLMRKTSPQLDS
jgi:hypothetical protein